MSSREMTINQIKTADKNFGDNHTIKVGGFKDKKGKSKLDLILDRLDKIDVFIEEQREFNKKQLEFNQFVITQFQKHGWVK